MTIEPRLYFSHSYHLDDLRFNEHIWRLLMKEECRAWIDTGREPLPLPSPVPGQLGAKRPMDISFNEWMMSQCDGFVAIVPNNRQSQYQLLEYRLAVRMGVPRLVAVQEGSGFDPLDSDPQVRLPTQWEDYWKPGKQDEIKETISEFKKVIEKHAAATEVLQATGYWRSKKTDKTQTIALLPPRSDYPDWDEWRAIQKLLERNGEAKWRLLPPTDFPTAAALMRADFDVLALDVGPRGTPAELLGYLQAVGPPQIRLCRVESDSERSDLERYLRSNGTERRWLFDRDAATKESRPALPRFLDGVRLDDKMQPVVFWTKPEQAAEQILATARRIEVFRSGLSPKDGGTRETLATEKNAREYFHQYWPGFERAYVFISYSGKGDAKTLAAQLADILRFQRFRCFHYESANGAVRLESGEDISSGLAVHISKADIIIYLIEEKFSDSDYCEEELRQGLELSKEGQAETRLYKLAAFREVPAIVESINVYDLPNVGWDDPKVCHKIAEDVEASAKGLGWALREPERDTAFQWLREDGCDTPEGVVQLLKPWGLTETELKDVKSTTKAELSSVLFRLPPDDDRKRRRVRKMVALLLRSLSSGNKERTRVVHDWIYGRRLIQRPPVLTAPVEDVLVLDPGPAILAPRAPAREDVVRVGKEIGQKISQMFRSAPEMDPARPTALCVESRKEFLATSIEWACESQDDEPLATRRPVRWRLKKIDARQTVFDSLKQNAFPPATLLLALNNPGINPEQQTRQLHELVRSHYEALGWPAELVARKDCNSVDEVLAELQGCKRQILHVAGHMGGEGFLVKEQDLDATLVVKALQQSEVQLIVLNGCSGGGVSSRVAVEYLTLGERLVRDAKVPEVVAHRIEISEDDALAFAREFHSAFFSASDGFNPATATLRARKAGSIALRYAPVAISQRES
jgi:TIR domain-containing protein